MATRLLGRGARLLGTWCPVSASSATAYLPPLLASQSLGPQLHSQMRRMCDGRPLMKVDHDNNSTFVLETVLEKHIQKASSPQEVLQFWNDDGRSGNQAAICIIKLARLSVENGVLDCSHYLQDPRMTKLLCTVSSEVSTVWNGNLVAVVRALFLLGVAQEGKLMNAIVTEALWRLRRFSYKQLATLMGWVGTLEAPQGQMLQLQNHLLKQLELRWTELADARTASVLIARVGHLSPTFMDKLEDKALELAEKFDADDIRKVALSLASQDRRSVPLLRALSYHLQQKPALELSTPLLLDVLYAFGKINFKQDQLFQRISAELLPRKAELSSSDVTRCAKSLAYLKWLECDLFERFSEHYLENSETYSTLQLCSLLLSLARLNFPPSKTEEFFSKVHEALNGQVQDLEPYLRVDLVWSLCILRQLKPQYLQSVLDPVFQTNLTGGNPSRAQNYRLKLLHIATTAQLEKLSPPTTSSVLSLHLPAQTQETRPTLLQASLKEVLRSLTSNGGSFRAGVNTIYGWTIDGELVIDSHNKPVDLLAIEAPHLCEGGKGSPMPYGAHRIAFLVGEFSYYNSRSKELMGRFAMQKHHLQQAGFLTVEVPYFEWQELKNDWLKVEYLKDKLRKAVAVEMAK
ncbi:hypothetical protein COCON_G00010880 [Conger conger]|uniref:FAST kinase domain-containing protein 4 n=1 Tax=Conger conger TaxID=82655 RepID=A0A9Q1E345_CONCO|nr:hypothetical protein COCON_G00010880 [Conger conger]